jgi:uncharacterized protein
MKVVYTADLHGLESLYQQLGELTLEEKPDVLIIGGDILPKHGHSSDLLQNQKTFITAFLTPYADSLSSRVPGLRIYTMMGNDDCLANMDHLEQVAARGRLHLLHGRKNLLPDGFALIGYGNIPPTPFSLKDSERIDTFQTPREPQAGMPVVSTKTGLAQIDDIAYFESLPTIEQELESLPAPNSFRSAVYVMHAPPWNTKLDMLYDGRHVGSRAIRAFIEKREPYLTLHGHIHEAPEASGSYVDKIGNTLCINPGQSTGRLYAVIFHLEDVQNALRHTVLA